MSFKQGSIIAAQTATHTQLKTQKIFTHYSIFST